MTSVHLLISGTVQGVGFRAWTKQLASELGIVGWVRNTDEGNVEIVANGNKTSLKELVSRAKTGLWNARVTGILVRWQKRTETCGEFTIKK